VANSLLLTVRRRNVEVRVVIAPILFFGEEKKKDLTQSSQRRRTEVAERRKRNPRAQAGMAVPKRQLHGKVAEATAPEG
jgi:hypothetical protein